MIFRIEMITLIVLLSLFTSFGRANDAFVKYEAERGFHVRKLQSPPCEGANKEMSVSLNQSTIVFTVNIPSDNKYSVILQYTKCTDSTQPISVKISANGIESLTSLLLGNSKGVWNQKEEYLFLRAGLNTIEYQVLDGHVAVDYILIKGGLSLASRGATVNYIEYQAEDATFTGTKIGPNWTFSSLPSEATERMAVTLTQASDYVEFLLTAPSNAAVFRYSIPDSPTGSGESMMITISINNVVFKSLKITSLYSWVYGQYPFTKNPGEGLAHHFFDDFRLLFSGTLPVGTKVRLQGDGTLPLTIDVGDFYLIPDPYPKPTNYLSVVDFGADPTGQKDSLNAFNQAITQAKSQSTGVWIPAGTFSVSMRITVDKIIIRGAGPWYTEIHGPDFGFFGNWAPNPSSSVKIYDLAIFGETRTRVDTEISSGAGGALGGGSILQNLWIEHNKCGMWLDGPFSDLLVTGCTIRNTFADGINFHKGIQNSIVEQTVIRNVGDDCLAMWPERPDNYGSNTFKFNTLSHPTLANTIAIYGATDNSATDNLCSDTLTFGAGIQIGIRFNSLPLDGTTTTARNTLIRTGSTGNNGVNEPFGAIWLIAEQGLMQTPVIIADSVISDSYFSAVLFHQYGTINNVSISNLTVNNGAYAFDERTSGSASFANVVAHGMSIGGQRNCGVPFQLNLGPGNSGWDDVHCTQP